MQLRQTKDIKPLPPLPCHLTEVSTLNSRVKGAEREASEAKSEAKESKRLEVLNLQAYQYQLKETNVA